MRKPISLADLDAAELAAGSHRTASDQLLAWARDPHPGDVVPVKELLTRAGEHLELDDDDAAAEQLYREATTMAGDTTLDPRCHLIALLLQRDDTDEAVELDGELRRDAPASVAVHEYLADVWRHHGDTRRAMGWLNRGIRRHERDGGFDAYDLGSLCRQRWQLRQDEGQPPDEYDLIGIGWAQQLAGEEPSRDT